MRCSWFFGFPWSFLYVSVLYIVRLMMLYFRLFCYVWICRMSDPLIDAVVDELLNDAHPNRVALEERQRAVEEVICIIILFSLYYHLARARHSCFSTTGVIWYREKTPKVQQIVTRRRLNWFSLKVSKSSEKLRGLFELTEIWLEMVINVNYFHFAFCQVYNYAEKFCSHNNMN